MRDESPLPLVLHVDDSEDDRAIVARILKRFAQPATLVQFANEAAARQALANGLCPQVALLDARLGLGGDGVELARWLRRAVPQAVVYILSGSLDPATDRDARAAGADGFLDKGTNFDQLEETLTATLQRHLSVSA